MKLLLLLSLATLALSQESFALHRVTETNDVPQVSTVLRSEEASGVQPGDKKVDKRSHGWEGLGWGGGYGHGWPIYSSGWSGHGIGHGHGGWGGGWGGWSGGHHGWYGGWYPSWPWWPISSGWHGSHGGWHSKW